MEKKIIELAIARRIEALKSLYAREDDAEHLKAAIVHSENVLAVLRKQLKELDSKE